MHVLRPFVATAAAATLLATLPSAQVLFRTIDGTWNNPIFPKLGSAQQPQIGLLRQIFDVDRSGHPLAQELEQASVPALAPSRE